MPNEEILAYIKDCLSQNYTKEQIKQSLIQAGWGNSQIDEAFLSTQGGAANTSPLQPKEVIPVMRSYTPEKINTQSVQQKSILPMAIIAGTAVIVVGIAATFWFLIRANTTSSQLAGEQTVPVKATTTDQNSQLTQQTEVESAITTNPSLQMSTEKWMTITPNNGPAWTSSHIEVREPFNVVSFYYQFVTPAEDLFQVFFDGQLVYSADQRVHGETIQYAEEVWVGDINPGIHTISFRVDAFGKTYSTVRISPISPALRSVLAAQAGASQLVYPGRTVVLNGSRSLDSRGVPLKYAWSQVKGTNITLSNPTASTTTFIAPPVGQTLIFQLVVTNPDNKIASDHTVVQTVNMGDLNADGSINTIDVDLLKSALNTPVTGLNDIRDLNNDGLITDVDVQKLTSFCAHSQCTIY